MRVKFCNNACPYLLSNYCACTHPVLKDKAKHLNQQNGRFIKICDSFFPSDDDSKNEKPKKKKYNNRKMMLDGILFDSEKEAKRYAELKLLEKLGEIKNLERQVPFVIVEKSKYGRELSYCADFVYNLADGTKVVEDVKSEATKTRLYSLKKRLVAERYGIIIKEYI